MLRFIRSKKPDPMEALDFLCDPLQGKESTGGLLRSLIIGTSVVAGAVALILVGWYAADREWVQVDSNRPFVYFEITALDPTGHPIAGAEVKIGAQMVGVTDSFGQWRRYLRVAQEQGLYLQIKKKTASQTYSVIRSFAVPRTRDASGERKIVHSFKLERYGSPQSQGLAHAAPHETPPGTQVAADKWDKIWFHVTSDAAAGVRKTFLEQQVLAALRQRAQYLGLAVSPQSQWQVEITPLSAGLQRSLPDVFRVVSTRAEEHTAFLRQYVPDAQQLARSILWGLKEQTKRTYTALRTDKGWYIRPIGLAWNFWRPSSSQVLRGSKGGLAKVLPSADGRIQPPPECAAFECTLTVGGDSASAGQGTYHITVKGPVTANSQLFYNGSSGVYLSDKTWKIKVSAGSRPALTLIEGVRILFREKILLRSAKQLQIAVPARPIAFRSNG